MKKLYFVTLLLFFQSLLYAQVNINNLKGSWVKVKVLRLDGSRVVDHFESDRDLAFYIFGTDSVRTIINSSIETKSKYTVSQNRLTLNLYKAYTIEKLTERELIYSEIKEGSKKDLADDELNRYFFVSAINFYDSLVQNHLVDINGDTIIADKYIFPYRVKNCMSEYINDGLGSPETEGRISGEFIISPLNSVINFKIIETKGFSDKKISKFTKLIEASSDNWILPTLSQSYYFKVNFSMIFQTIKNGGFTFSGNNFIIGKPEEPRVSFPAKQTRLANEYYDKGLNYIDKEKFNEAIGSFTKCIENDSIYILAYYDRAYAYYTTNNLEKACLDWKYLSSLDQMKAKEYYKSKCNK